MLSAGPHPKLVAAATRTSRWIARGLIGLGVCVLAGWVFDLPRLTTLYSGSVSMKVNAALLFILLGVSIHAAGEQGAARVRRMCALAVVVLAVVTGVQDLIGLDLGIDRLPLPAAAADEPRGRMSLAAAVAFGSLGAGTLCVGWGRNERARDVFAVLALSIMSFALCGYVLGAPSLYHFAPYGAVALPTAFGLVLAGVALLAARPRRGISALFVSRSAAGVMLRRAAPFITVAPVLLGWLRLRGQLAGYYDTRLGIALTSMSMIVLSFGGALLIGASLERSEQRRARAESDQRFLLELTNIMLTLPDWEELAYQITRRLGQHLGLSRCAFVHGVDAERVLISRDYCAPGESSLRGELTLAQFSPESLAECRAGKTLVVCDAENDARTQARYASAYQLHRLRAFVNVPFLRKGEWVATLAAISHQPRTWEMHEIELIRLTGERVWSWVERLRVIEELKHSEARNLQLIAELSTAKSELEQRVADRTVELSRSLAERDKALAERETLLQEVHHRVKNNLQVVASLINMQMRTLGDPASRASIGECHARVLAIALIHEKLYQAKNYAQVAFADYARTLAATIFQGQRASSDIMLELAMDDVTFGVDLAIPCGLILNELLTNALKHGFRGRDVGKIRVELAQAAGQRIRLAVKDDGPGLPVDFDLKQSKSLGLQLIVSLARQIDAQLEWERGPNAGFVLTFAQRA